MNHLVIHAEQSGPRISRHLYGQSAGHVGTGIYAGLWVGEDSPIPHTRGLRNDVVAALRAIAVPNIRWPGGGFAETYHWRDGIGPRAARPLRANCLSRDTVENNHFGTHEFMDLCEQVGAEPYLCGNLGGGTAQEMAEWLAYLTLPAASPLSAERRANGREQPWLVKWWAVGNENWGCGGHMTATHYAAEYRRYQTFCRHHSGGPLYRVACGWEDEWNETVLREAHDYIDGLSIHHHSRQGAWGRAGDPTDFTLRGADRGFPEEEWWEVMRLADNLDAFIKRTLAIMTRHDPAQRIGLVVDEWGTRYVEPADKPAGSVHYQQNTMRDAVVAAHTFNIFHRHAGRLHLANIAQMVNVRQAMILTGGPRMLLTPTYHVFDLFQVHHDATLVPTELEADCRVLAGRDVPTVSASASRHEDGTLHLSLCNLDPARPAAVRCVWPGAGLRADATIAGRILTTPAMDTHNTFVAPRTVAPAPFTGFSRLGQALEIALPARAVVVLAVK